MDCFVWPSSLASQVIVLSSRYNHKSIFSLFFIICITAAIVLCYFRLFKALLYVQWYFDITLPCLVTKPMIKSHYFFRTHYYNIIFYLVYPIYFLIPASALQTQLSSPHSLVSFQDVLPTIFERPRQIRQ